MFEDHNQGVIRCNQRLRLLERDLNQKQNVGQFTKQFSKKQMFLKYGWHQVAYIGFLPTSKFVYLDYLSLQIGHNSIVSLY